MLAEVSIFDLGLVFICSDASGSRETALRQIFKPDLLTRLNIRTVAMNACTTTNLGIINLFKYHTKLFPKCTISPRFFTSVFWTRRAEISSVVSNFDCSCTAPEPKQVFYQEFCLVCCSFLAFLTFPFQERIYCCIIIIYYSFGVPICVSYK